MPESTVPALDPEDFYYEGPFLVFTAAYHLKRGYCCGNDCRHCPYTGNEKRSKSVERQDGSRRSTAVSLKP